MRVIALSSLVFFACAKAPLAPQNDSETLATDSASALEVAEAESAVGLLQSCAGCHPMSRATVRQWVRLTYTAAGNCARFALGDDALTPRETVDCFRNDPNNPFSSFRTSKLGIFAAGAGLQRFKDVFIAAYGADRAESQFAMFTQRVAMPKGTMGLSDESFDKLLSWFLRGAPALDRALPEDPPPATCEESRTDAMAAHTETMATRGWRAVNEENGMHMLPLEGFPEEFTWSPSGTSLRRVRTLSHKTAFWSRSSADGRFTGSGIYTQDGGMGAVAYDLLQDREIKVHALYDPGFFPDNSGFVFQGVGPNSDNGAVCSQSLLASGTTEITFDEPECKEMKLGLYQHLARGLDGGDYFVVNSTFESDDSGHDPVREKDPPAGFNQSSAVNLTPMINSGSGFEQKEGVGVDTPFEGDNILSPSAQLLVGRLSGPHAKQTGYVIRKLTATKTETGYTADAEEIARICIKGGKPAISYDERFMVLHHYLDTADYADFGYPDEFDRDMVAKVVSGVANIYLVDLQTGTKQRITDMPNGMFALYPHFRSDGWIYFIVRDTNSGAELLVASDAARKLQQ